MSRRPFQPVELILRRLVVKRRYGWGYEATERCVAGNLGLRQCCRVYGEPVPDATPPLRWAHLIGAATLAAFDARVGALACSLKVTRGRVLSRLRRRRCRLGRCRDRGDAGLGRWVGWGSVTANRVTIADTLADRDAPARARAA